MQVKSMTLRLPREQAEALEMIATVDGRPMSEEIREALLAHVERRRSDPEFQARLKGVLEQNREALRRLTDAS
jgi:predicted DNA-binding protein